MRFFLLTCAALLLGACTPPPIPDDGGDATLTSDGSIDAVSLDVADARRETSVRDGAVTGGSLPDVQIDPGMCGISVRECLCGCGTNGTCQSTCIFSNEDCGVCMLSAAMNCCPMENDAFEQCITRNNCETDVCIMTNCSRELATFNTCFARQQTSNMQCQMRVRGCLGSDYPSIRCVMP